MIHPSIPISALFATLAVLGTVLHKRFKKATKESKSKLDDTLYPLVASTGTFFFTVIYTVFMLNSFGISIPGVTACLGIIGMAVALGAKRKVAQIISVISLLFSRPFDVGDIIESSKFQGEVISLTFSTTVLLDSESKHVYIPTWILTEAILTIDKGV